MPIEALGTEINTFFWDVFTLRDHIWHRRELNGKLAVVRYSQDPRATSPQGVTAKNWGRATTGTFTTGPSTLLSIFTSITQQVEWLQRENPEYLLTHPSVLQSMALHCQNNGIVLPSLKEVRTISEALPDGIRELVRDTWEVPLVDVYSTIELGYLALQCPEHEHYHVQSEGALVEILNDNGSPCRPGEIGRVVVTNLHNYAMPLIRYEVGDYAEVGVACNCGRGLPVIKRILGRYRNLLTKPNGERQWPRLAVMDLHEIAPVEQFQAIQHSKEEIEVKVVMQRPLHTVEKEALLKRFKQTIGATYDYSITEVEKLERSQGGKYEEFISML
jgi:phenylacetate-CoA ligase